MNRDFVFRIKLASRFVILDRLIVASGTLEHGCGIQTAGELAAGAGESLVGILILTEAAVSQGEVVQNALVLRREFRSALQAINRGAVVAVLIERETEIVERLRVLRLDL